MRLEILLGSEDPIIYPINKSRIIIGSGEGCDIILEADGISRRHLVLSSENDHYFIVDQGSTNGSFVNEEKLQPGKKVEFNSFFPVRLGSNTLITLISNEEDLVVSESTNPSIPRGIDFHIPTTSSGTSEETRVISLKELKKAKTDELIKKRDELRTKVKRSRTAKGKKKKKDSYWPTAVGMIVLLGAIYFNLIHHRILKALAPEVLPPVAPVQEAPEVTETAPEGEVSPLIEKDLLPTKEQVNKVFENAKCTIDREIYLCKLLDLSPPLGATSVGLTDYVFVDATPFYQESEKLLGPRLATPDAVRDVTGYMFLLKRVPPLDLQVLDDSRLVFGLLKTNPEGKLELENVLAILPDTYNKRKEDINVTPFRSGRSSLHNSLYFTRSIYSLY